MMTKSEYVAKLIEMSESGKFPAAVDKMCVYKSGEQRCAVGILIPPQTYCREMENKGVKALFSLGFLDSSILPEGVSPEQLAEVQFLHDGMVDRWSHKKFVDGLEEVFQ